MGMTYHVPSDEELARIEAQGRERDKHEPRIEAARFEAATGRLHLELRDGASVSFPARSMSDFAEATDEQITEVELIGDGQILHWATLDVDMSTIALLQIVLKMRTPQSTGRQGGRANTPAKVAAAQANGKKGGRPHKVSQPA